MTRKLVAFCGGIIAALCFGGGAAPLFAQTMPDCTKLTRNLAVGARGDDVKVLQEILNMSPRTQIAETGTGSPGNESAYFGAKTRTAVIKFQSIYAAEVLAPAGLTKGNGFVGALTRAKLATLCSAGGVDVGTNSGTNEWNAPTATPVTPPTQAPTTPVTTPLGSASASGFQSATPVLMYPSSYTVMRNATVDIYGVSLGKTWNAVHLGDYVIAGGGSSDGSVLRVTIPANAPLGKNDLWFENEKGQSNKSFLIVTGGAVVAPSVSDFTPKEGPLGTLITVTGSGFATSTNTIRVSGDVIKNVSSQDGTTLQFTIAPPLFSARPAGHVTATSATATPIWFYILNDSGMSNGSVFQLKI